MDKPIIVIGLGEMGSVFARGLLRNSKTIVPLNRADSITDVAQQYPEPAGVLVSVGEKDLPSVLKALPETWKTHLILLQNELLPRDWLQYDIRSPTIISVWFEKKPGQDYKVIIPSPIYGPLANIIIASLDKLDIPYTEMSDMTHMINALVGKNVYILTTNIAGLVVGGTVAELWRNHQNLTIEIAHEIIKIQAWLTNTSIDRDLILNNMVVAFEGDLQHQCMGRSSNHRLTRAISFADEARLTVPKLRQILSEVR